MQQKKSLGNFFKAEVNKLINLNISKWANQNGYVPVEECGEYSKETGFIPNHAKIKELNEG